MFLSLSFSLGANKTGSNEVRLNDTGSEPQGDKC